MYALGRDTGGRLRTRTVMNTIRMRWAILRKATERKTIIAYSAVKKHHYLPQACKQIQGRRKDRVETVVHRHSDIQLD